MQTNDVLKKTAKIAFILYMICLFWILILKCNLRAGVLESRYLFGKITLLERCAYFLGRFSTTNIREAALNIFVFIPLGLTLPFVLNKLDKNTTDKKVYRTICLKSALIGVAISICAEICQLIVAIGGFTYVDIINNSIGAFIGALLNFLLAHRVKDVLTIRIINYSIIAMIGLLIFAAVNTIQNIEIYFLYPVKLL